MHSLLTPKVERKPIRAVWQQSINGYTTQSINGKHILEVQWSSWSAF